MANKNGGAIYYDLFRPRNLELNTFNKNTALYGKNYASYPFKMKKIASLNGTDKPIIVGMEDNLTVFESLQLVSG